MVQINQEKKHVSLTAQRQRTGGSTIAAQDEELVLYSGECSY